MKTKTSILFYALIMGLLVLSNSCKKDDPKEDAGLKPVVTTTKATDITQTSVVSGGSISDDGGAEITVRGVCWGTNETHTINDNKTEDGQGKGNFTSQITDLTSNTTYYVRAYATNSAGTGYGEAISFKTLEGKTLPVLTTTDVTEITPSSAVSGGNITNDGGMEVTARGVCWSTSKAPTIENHKTIDGENTGSFISQITDLDANTTYYVRAYATNVLGTSYGKEISFTTLEMTLPVITTTEVTKITQLTAVSGGTITSNGGSPITARGVCWSRDTDMPTTDFPKTEDGTGIGSFVSEITGIFPSDIAFWVRAYATNSKGTAYGEPIQFYPGPAAIDGNGYEYPIVQIGTQIWMAENLKATKYDDWVTDIPTEENGVFWSELKTPAYCWYDNNNHSKGALYNWYAVQTGRICPSGWHVPSREEWETLIDFLGGAEVAGGKLKERNYSNWTHPNTGATNASGFNALPGGHRNDNGYFKELNDSGYWWQSTDNVTVFGTGYKLSYNKASIETTNAKRSQGQSVRCIAD